MPSQVKNNSTFKIDLMCESTEFLGTTTFVISYGGDIKYNSCKVSDSDKGYIVDFENNGMINITYLNTSGIDISNNKKLAEITMKSGEVGSGWIDIKTIYSASSNEQTITDSNSTHYEIDVVEKVTNKSNASGTSVNNKDSSKSSSKSSSSKNSSSKSSSSKSSSTKKSISQSSVSDDVADDKDSTDENTDTTDMIDLSEKPNSIIVFIAGGIFAVSIVIVIIVSYNMGKKNSKKQDESE